MPLSSPAPDAYWYAGDLALTNGASVTSWTDRIASKVLTGATSHQPTYNTTAINQLPGVAFNGSSQYLRLASGFGVLTSSSATVVVIAKMGSTAGRIVSMWAAADSATTDVAGPASFVFESNGGGSGYLTFEGGDNGGTNYQAQAGSVGPNQPTPPSGAAYVAVNQKDSQSFTILTQGVFSGAHGGITNAALSTGQLTFGADYQATPAHYSDVTICEVLMWNRKLTQAEIFTVNQYAQQTYAITITPLTSGGQSALGAYRFDGPSTAVGQTTINWGYQILGDTVVLTTAVASSTLTVSTVSDGRVTTWTRAGSTQVDSTNVRSHEYWYGVLTKDDGTTGPTTVAWSGSVTTLSTMLGIIEYEYSAGSGVTYTSPKIGVSSNTASTTGTIPTLTTTQTQQPQFLIAQVTSAAATTSGVTLPAGSYNTNYAGDGAGSATLIIPAMAPGVSQSGWSLTLGSAVVSTGSAVLFQATLPANEIELNNPGAVEEQFNDPGATFSTDQIGDLNMMLLAGNSSPVPSGGGVTTWTQQYSWNDTGTPTNAGITSLWTGIVTTALGNQSFSSGGTSYINNTPYTTSQKGDWIIGAVQASLNNTSSTTHTFPSITTGPLTAEQMVWGYVTDANGPTTAVQEWEVYQPYNNASFAQARNARRNTTYTLTYTASAAAKYSTIALLLQFLPGISARNIAPTLGITATLSRNAAIDAWAAITSTETSELFQIVANPYGADTLVWVEWGPTSGYGNTTGTVDIGSGVVDAGAEILVTGLINNATYHYRIAASNASGNTYTADQTFTVTHDYNPGFDLFANRLTRDIIDGSARTEIKADIGVTSLARIFAFGPTQVSAAITALAALAAAGPTSGSGPTQITAAITSSLSVAAAPTQTVQLTAAIGASAAVTATNKESIALTAAIGATAAVTTTNAEAVAVSSAITEVLTNAVLNVTDLVIGGYSTAAWWKLADGTGTTAVDSSGNSHAGTATGGVTFGSTGIIPGDNVAAFDGTSGYISLTASGTLYSAFQNHDFSVGVLVNPTAGASTAFAIGGGGGYQSFAICINGGKWDISLAGIDVSLPVSPIYGQWAQLVVTYTASSQTLTFSQNGQQLAEAVLGTAINVNNASLTIGTMSWYTPNYWKGSIGEVFVLPSVLSPTQISTLWNDVVSSGNYENVAISTAIGPSLAVTASSTEAVALTAAIGATSAVTATNAGSTPITAAIAPSVAVTATATKTVQLTAAIGPSLAVAATSQENVNLTMAGPQLVQHAVTNNISGTSLAVTLPSNPTVGNLLVFMGQAANNGHSNADLGTGWTTITSGFSRDNAYYKVCTATEAATNVFTLTFNTSDSLCGAMYEISGVGAIDQILQDSGSNGSTGQGTGFMTPAAASEMLLIMYWSRNGTTGASLVRGPLSFAGTAQYAIDLDQPHTDNGSTANAFIVQWNPNVPAGAQAYSIAYQSNTYTSFDTDAVLWAGTPAIGPTLGITAAGPVILLQLTAAIGPSLAVSTTDTVAVALSATSTPTLALTTTDTKAVALSATIGVNLALTATDTASTALTAALAPLLALSSTNREAVALTAALGPALAIAATITSGSSGALTSAIGPTLAIVAADSVAIPETAALTPALAVTANVGRTIALTAAIGATSAVTATNRQAVALTSNPAPNLALAATSREAVAVTASTSPALSIGSTATPTEAITAAIGPALGVAATNHEVVQLSAAIGPSVALAATTSGTVPLTATIGGGVALAASNHEAVALSTTIAPASAVATSNTRGLALTAALGPAVALASNPQIEVLITASMSPTLDITADNHSSGIVVQITATVGAVLALSSTTFDWIYVGHEPGATTVQPALDFNQQSATTTVQPAMDLNQQSATLTVQPALY